MTDIYDSRPPWRQQFDSARDPYTARNVLGITASGGGGAPVGAEYITSATNATLTAERVLTNTATITWDFSTPGQAKANAAAGGNVSNSGTPTVGQYAKWVTATTIQGVAPATVLSDIGAQPAGSYQPLDGDLTSLAAAAGTNTIYYRSAANTWSPVVVSTGLAFSGGNLTATATAPGTPQRTVYTTGSGTYTTPASARWLEVEMAGGGGGGGAGQDGGSGSGGNASTFGSVTALAGGGGNSGGSGAGGAGGGASGVPAGGLGIVGENGSYGNNIGDGATTPNGADGGAGYFGGRGVGGVNSISGPGNNAIGNTGSGGGGGARTAAGGYGGAGGGAGAYARFIITSPAASYSYLVGSGGGGGAVGSAGHAGGAGASGIIIVTAYF
jgi:hypothetical protein